MAVGVSLRLDAELHKALKRMARQKRRSMHAQILVILERAVREWENRGKSQAKPLF